MFKQVIYETWLNWVPYVAFAVTATIFITFVIRAIALRKDRCDRLANLPLE